MRPLTQLTKHDVDFIWTLKCEKSVQFLKEALCDHPILVYPDPNLPYILYTNASKLRGLTQTHTTIITGTAVTVNLPVAYISGLFHGCQLNWAVLTKEAFAIYMSVRKLNFYVAGSNTLIRSDHLPLKKLLQRNTLNATIGQ